ncbi:MAG TPA: NADH-quinone oxidoreductase subunit L [Planctomycetes bacterium]|nr:NADH-quinone oxidoreductase subunit L [Planctomycetota bacterium]
MIDAVLTWIQQNPYLVVSLALVPAVPLIFFQILPLLVVMERRGAAFIQDRPGPNRAGIWIPGLNIRLRAFGLIYNACDFVKLAVKERFDPKFASAFGYYAAGPFIPLMVALIVPAFIPMFAGISYIGGDGALATLAGTTITTHSGLLALFAFSSLSIYGIVLGSWASNSKFSLLGGMRSSAMMISYEVSIGLAAAGMFLIVGSFDLAKIAAWQGEHTWGMCAQPLGFVLFTIAMFAECNRNPFDVIEGESEIVAGFHTEYGSMRFMLIMSAEYYHVIIASALISTLYLGSYHLSPVPLPLGPEGALVDLDDQWMRANIGPVLAVMLGLGALGAAGFAWLINGRRVHYLKSGASDGAVRAREYVLYTGAIGGVAVLMAAAAVAFAGWTPSPQQFVAGIPVWGWKVDLATALAQFHVLVGKILLVSWLFVWVRWTLPRFRYDQIMALGWKVLLNAALINLLITAVIVKVIG